MTEHEARTFVGTLVLLDVLDAGRPQHGESNLSCVQDVVRRTAGHLQPDECVVIDASHGATLCFPGDPEDAVFLALGLRDSLAQEAACGSGLRVRLAVHLGPVRISGTPDARVLQGEGLRFAQQLLAQAKAGQLVSSRSLMEVASGASAEHRGLFSPLGRVRTSDGQQLELYEVAPSGPEAAGEPTWRHPEPVPIPLGTPIQPPPRPSAPTPAIGVWRLGALDELSVRLARVIGPLAPVLVRRAARDTDDPARLVSTVADSIPGDADRDQFLEASRGWARRARVAAAPPVVHPPPSSHTPATAEGELTSDQRATLELALAPHLGPIARVMVDRVAREAKDWGAACESLSASIADQDSRQSFLQTLARPFGGSRPAAREPVAPPPAPARGKTPSPALRNPSANALDEEVLRRAEQELARSLGPVARMLVRRAAQKAHTPDDLFRSLAAELPEGPERERFLASRPGR